jgi:hypothetical protein
VLHEPVPQSLFNDQECVVVNESVGLVAQDAMREDHPQSIEGARGRRGDIIRELDSCHDLLLILGRV